MELTMIMIVLAFVPFLVIIVDSMFPEKETLVKTKGLY